jgi:hypothetical protein
MATTKPRPQIAGAGEARHVANAAEIVERRAKARITRAKASELSAKTESGTRNQPINQIPMAHHATDPAHETAASSTGSARVHSSRRSKMSPGSTNAKAANGNPIGAGIEAIARSARRSTIEGGGMTLH